MYSETDLSIINGGYFALISLKPTQCILKSNNTGHTWCITLSTDNFFILHHKHKDNDKFHFHSGCETMEACFLEIVEHDMFQLRGRRFVNTKRRTYFDDIVDLYKANADSNNM